MAVRAVWQWVHSWLPPFPQLKKDLKASIALLIALVFCFDQDLANVTGQGVILVAIVMIFYFPVRTYGIQTEAIVMGTLSSLVCALWSLLGSYLANCARDPRNPQPVQPGPSAVFAVFFFLPCFWLTYLRVKTIKGIFPAINGFIILSFTMTESASYPVFSTEITWTFLLPFAVTGALALAVNYLIWPDDSVENYVILLCKVLTTGKEFIKENAEAFLDLQAHQTGTHSLPVLKCQLDEHTLLLVDYKHAVQREVLFNKLSHRDISRLTHHIKNLYPGMHDLGLSNISEKTFRSHSSTLDLNAFDHGIQQMKDPGHQLAKDMLLCIEKMEACLALFLPRSRSVLNACLWPFPRLLSLSSGPTIEAHQAAAHQLEQVAQELRHSLDQFCTEQSACGSDYMATLAIPEASENKPQPFAASFCDTHTGEKKDPASFIDPTFGPLFLLFLYQHGLRTLSKRLLEMATTVQTITSNRTSRRLHFPTMTFKKWLSTSTLSVDTTASTPAAVSNAAPVSGANMNGISLVRTRTRRQTSAPRRHHRPFDPDVEPASTRLEHVFDHLHTFFCWTKELDTLFALKVSLGSVLLCIPAWMPSNAAWYNDWRGKSLLTFLLKT
ncbi:hypothetical protein DM01DRAFT_1408971 [Hesseltinella vesiculosa]|uniref:Putative ER transporter 6TM N-terminal domain-containing protein n=1 Tax=Hesseltinella vesiculosa TaxID=101127 RepID=A0A1X2GC32_9FUNG|nr:hypothetical protein DM01DRAFT_1408971 [Hesseltinella vesiculosa]